MKKIMFIFALLIFNACQNNDIHVYKNPVLYNRQLKESLDKKDFETAKKILEHSPSKKDLEYYKNLVKYYYMTDNLDTIKDINKKEKNMFIKSYVDGLIFSAMGIYYYEDALNKFYDAENYRELYNGSLAPLYYAISVIESKKDNFDKALTYINKAIKESNDEKFIVLKAFILMKTGKYQDAQRLLNDNFSAIKQQKNILKAQNIMDMIFTMKKPMPKKLKEAYSRWLSVAQTGKNLQIVLKVAKEGMRDYPEYSEMYTLAGIASYLLDNKAEAVTYFNKAISVNPDQPFNYVQMGIVYFNLKQYFKSEDYFLKAIEKNKYLPMAYAYLAKIKKEAGDTAKAIYYKELQLKFQNDYKTQMELVKLYKSTKSPHEIKKYLETLIKKYPSQKELYREMVHIYDELIDEEENPKLKLKLRKEQLKYEKLYHEKDEEESKRRLIKAEIENNGSKK